MSNNKSLIQLSKEPSSTFFKFYKDGKEILLFLYS